MKAKHNPLESVRVKLFVTISTIIILIIVFLEIDSIITGDILWVITPASASKV